jgi:cob(I)alamin adenosyltransferase
MARALGNDWKVAFVQFIKHWNVGEHSFIYKVQDIYGDKLVLHKGGRGFYDANDLSAAGVSEAEHKAAAKRTFEFALKAAQNGDYDLVICDEINNAVHQKLIPKTSLKTLIAKRSAKTSLCLTGRDFPEDFLPLADIATSMTKLRHHFDDKFLANKGIDY